MNENIPMNQTEQEIRRWLSDTAKTIFDDMYYGRSLGAASNIKAIGKIYIDIANQAEKSKLAIEDIIARIVKINDYFIEKRGKSSHAIISAIKIMTGSIVNNQYSTYENLCTDLKSAYELYSKDAAERSKRIMNYGWELLKDKQKILLFDYSSTVNSMMQVAHDHNKVLDVYIPESRILDGGHQFLRNGINLNHSMHYIPDVSVSKFIPDVDACFIGAETLYPDGTVANTAGSDLIGILCNMFNVPLYVPTTLIKLNPQGFTGFKKPEHIGSAGKHFGLQLEDEIRNCINIECVGLVQVPPKDIRAFITEYGIIEPKDLDGICRNYMKELNEEIPQ